jgi:hypothetical protein
MLIVFFDVKGIVHREFVPSDTRERITLRLAVYRRSVRLGAEPLKTHGQDFFFI